MQKRIGTASRLPVVADQFFESHYLVLTTELTIFVGDDYVNLRPSKTEGVVGSKAPETQQQGKRDLHRPVGICISEIYSH